jgi:hydroxyacylglutathione hydrolase
MEIYRLVFNPIDVNTYIIADDSGECAIIDCGCYDADEFIRFNDFLVEKNLKPVLLLNTHCHLDHIFGDGLVLKKYKLASLCHKDELYNRHNAVHVAEFFGMVMDPPPEPGSYLSDGQIKMLGKASFEALHVPGHSPGSLAFYFKDEKLVFTGDSLFAGSIGRTDLPGGNYETLINSIQEKLFTLPPDTVVYPGHGDNTTIEKEIRSNPYFIHS